MQEDHVPHVHRHLNREESRNRVADEELSSKHGQVGHGVGRRVGPAALGAEFLRPGSTLEDLLGVDLVVRPVTVIRDGVKALSSPNHQATTEPQAAECGEQHDHDRTADEFARGELPSHENDENDAEFEHQVGGGEHEDHGGHEIGTLYEE